jgi:hypothetical protein
MIRPTNLLARSHCWTIPYKRKGKTACPGRGPLAGFEAITETLLPGTKAKAERHFHHGSNAGFSAPIGPIRREQLAQVSD